MTSLIVFALPLADVVIGNPKHQHYFLSFGVSFPELVAGCQGPFTVVLTDEVTCFQILKIQLTDNI